MEGGRGSVRLSGSAVPIEATHTPAARVVFTAAGGRACTAGFSITTYRGDRCCGSGGGQRLCWFWMDDVKWSKANQESGPGMDAIGGMRSLLTIQLQERKRVFGGHRHFDGQPL